MKNFELVIEVSPKIFFATEGRGVKGYSAFISDVRTVISSIENVEGLAWDSMNQQFYYSTAGKIHRASLKGDQTDTASSVLRVPQCKFQGCKIELFPSY